MCDIKQVLSSGIFKELRHSIRFDYDLANKTWMHCGGKASALFRPSNISELSLFLQHFPFKDRIFPLGCCSNVVVRDGGIDGVVIRLGKDFSNISIVSKDDSLGTIKIKCGGVALDSQISSFCLLNSIGGLEFLSTIPGTIGGNIRMNAGCYGKQISDVIDEFGGVDYDGNIVRFRIDDVDFKYRQNPLPQNIVFTDALLTGRLAKQDEIKELIKEFEERRNASQPIRERTSGSTFINPDGMSAWQLIDKCGLRGFKIGGAMVSNKHCNFLINYNNATSADIESVIKTIQSKVFENCGVDLKLEIQILGLDKE